jgi:hypothetical protein
MNKNAIIWLLIVIVVVGGGYWLITNNQNTSTSQPYANTQNTIPTNGTGNTATIPSTVPPLTLSSPTVETSSNSSVSSAGASVTGVVTPNGLPTNYWFEYGNTNTLGQRTATQQIGSGFYSTPAPTYIIGLNANTAYYYRLMASNNLGTAYGATYSFTTNSNPTPKAAMPTARTSSATNIASVNASVNGQVNPNGFQTNYWFEYGKDRNLGSTTTITSVSENAPLMSLVNVSNSLTGLNSNTKYYFRINAQNQFGTVNGSILSFTTKK